MCSQRIRNDLSSDRRLRKLFKSYLNSRWGKWLFPVTGLTALIWFLVRVIPKPSRATYPCQRVAFPLASSFVAYILGLFVTTLAIRRARQRLYQSRYVLAGVCILVAVTCAWLTIGIDGPWAKAEYIPVDPPNSPMGTGKGIFPSRVVWVHDANATDWDGSAEYYWDDEHTDANVVEAMMSDALRWLTGEVNDVAAWDKLFKHFNTNHSKGNVGYTPGEKIAIKPNFVEHRKHDDWDNFADLCPAVVVGLLKQLILQAGVPESCITVCDSSRYMSDKIFNRCHDLFPDVNYIETNWYTTYGDFIGTDPNRPPAQPTDVNVIFYSSLNVKDNNNPIPSDKIPMPFYEADYVINLAIMKGHRSAGVTLSGKNWYGSFCTKPGQWAPNNAHHNLLPINLPGYSQYRPMVELMGHEHLGGKTMLFILDGLWGFPQESLAASAPVKWQNTPFNDDYPSSILMSQDHVAIDSVALDFLRAEFADNMGNKGIEGGIDDYLHEAALAHDPCSGTFYDPVRPIGHPDATRMESLGVHEHWNNETSKQYSRNLGTGPGIELVSSPTVKCAALDGDISGDCRVDYLDVNQISDEWLASGSLASDLDGSGLVDFNDFDILAGDWSRCNLMPQVFQEDFEDCNLSLWQATDPAAWRIEDGNEGNPGKVLSQFKQSVYSPPYRSPKNIILVPDVNVGSFVMELQMLSTKAYYSGRDLCLFFGYQDASHFYYAHIADVADDVHNRIHIVDGADRTPIEDYRNAGNNWSGGWHTVRLVRDARTGSIKVYFDDMTTPVMTAVNTRFVSGKVGVGSFDDTGQFDNIRLWGW